MPRLPPASAALELYTYASTGTSSHRSGRKLWGSSQLCTVLWMANSGVATMVPEGTVKPPTRITRSVARAMSDTTGNMRIASLSAADR